MKSNLYIYYLALNSLLLLLMGVDKLLAIGHKRRIPEATLLTLSLIGGGLGGFVGMLFFRHKIRKHYFSITFIISIILHLVIIFNI